MRIFSILLLFVAIGCYTTTASDITSKVIERKGDDGKVAFRMKTTYRGTNEVMMEIYHPNAQGVMVLTARSFFVGGDVVMSECASHKFGKLDTIIVYQPGTDDMEMFRRDSDGSVRPVSTRTLEACEHGGAALANSFTMMETNSSDKAIAKDLRETRKKIQDIKREEAAGGQ